MNPNVLPWIVFAPLATALAVLALGRVLGRHSAAAMLFAACFSFSAALSLFLTSGSPPTWEMPWIPELGISLRLRADPFGLFFAMLVSGIGALVAAYSWTYVDPLEPRRLARYYAALSTFMASMLGIALADDLIVLAVFWEATSLSSFLLIGFWYERDEARKGANTALQVTALGGLVMLAGFLLVGWETGSFGIAALSEDAALQARLTSSPIFLPALLLILFGAFTKSAQVPFHFWLPGAMVAPTPVSTYLHAATMVKAGVFLAGRMLPIFGEAALWSPLLISFGAATFLLGAYQAFLEDDLKGLLARTTVSTLGLVMMVYGLRASDQDALQILNHAAYKGALFLCVGIVEHSAGTRSLRQLGGMRHELPITFIVCLLASLSMAGLPPFLGFLAKEGLYAELLGNALLGTAPRALLIAVVVAANAFVFAASFRLLVETFLGPRRTEGPPHGHAHEHGESPALWLPPAVLASVATGLGLLGVTPWTERIANALTSDPGAHLHVSLIPAHSGPLLLSAATVGLGVVVYRTREWWLRRQGPGLVSMQETWDRMLGHVTVWATTFATHWQSGSLRWYFSGILVFVVGLPFIALTAGGLSLRDATINLGNLTWTGAVAAALTAVAALAVVRARTRLAAAIALTSVGFLVALLFVVYRSPDIVLTQILIETVSTIFILLVLYFMPPFRADGMSPAETAWNLALSLATGTVAFLFVLLATSPGFRETRNLAVDYLSRSLPEAGGRNVVNVIIVDFRAIDTTGEITVLVVVGLCIFGVLRARRQRV